MSVAGDSFRSRARVQIADCDEEAVDQRWTLTDEGLITVDEGRMCLDVRARDTTSPAVAQIYPCHGEDNQRWEIGEDGAVVGEGSGLCLDVYDESTADGAVVGMWTCNEQTNQQWNIGPSGEPTPPTPEEPDPEDPDPQTPVPEVCEDEGTCVAGRGLQLHDTAPGQGLYKNANGDVSLPEDLPSALEDTDLLTYDAYPDYGPDSPEFSDDLDSRTDEVIEQVQSTEGDRLLVALPSAELSGGGWSRLGDGEAADFVLDTEDDSRPAYWLYAHANTDPGTWVDLPDGAESSELPPFVFGPDGELTFANPLPLPDGGVEIVPGNDQIFNPTMTVVPGSFDGDGDGVADGDTDGDGTVDNDVYLAGASGASLWKVWRSTDRGATWEQWAKPIVNLNRQTLFFHQGAVYLMGTLKDPDETGDPDAAGVIYESTDGGQTFGEGTLLPFDAGDAPANVQIADGRIWKSVGVTTATGNAGIASLASAPVDADLMDADSWTMASPTEDVGNESVTILTREGDVAGVTRVDDSTAAIVHADGAEATRYDPETDRVDLPNHGKFSVQYDPVSDRYWALTNGEGGQPRNVLNLFSSTDLSSWELEREVLAGPSSRYHGFNYPNMFVEGEDLIFVSRTAWETPYGHNGRWHDGNMLTFHRVENFRGTS